MNARPGTRNWGSGARGARRRSRRIVLLGLLPLATGCAWFTDFKQQPKIDPWESANDSTPPRGNPQFSIPVYGTAAPGFMYGRGPAIPTIDSMAAITNPVPADARSIENGRKMFQINCAPCHGASGNGNGPAVRYGYVPINLLLPITQGRTDGYIFGMIRNGRGLMPSYNRIEEPDRWDIVNYLRALQGRGAAPADTTAPAQPGVTGNRVPGPSISAPTRPAPYFKRVGSQAGLSSGAAPAAAATSDVDTTGAARTPATPGAPAARDTTSNRTATPTPARPDTTRRRQP